MALDGHSFSPSDFTRITTGVITGHIRYDGPTTLKFSKRSESTEE
jgi:hypothetical protein